MKNFQALASFSAILATIAHISTSALAADKPMVIQNGDSRVERVKELGGVLDLSKLSAAVKDPTSPPRIAEMKRKSLIVNQEELEALFREWMLGNPPKVDFAKQVVTARTWGGSRIQMSRHIDDEGNLFVVGAGGTKDIVRAPGGGPGLTYLIEVYTLTNIKAVNGQKWPSPEQEAEEDGSDQPATDPESEQEGAKKPKPEAEARPQ